MNLRNVVIAVIFLSSQIGFAEAAKSNLSVVDACVLYGCTIPPIELSVRVFDKN